MQRSLLRHPLSPASPVERIEVDAVRFEDGRTAFMFMVIGDIGEVAIPPPAGRVRADELWRHTCFEAFVAPPSGGAYFELNFSPSGAWAAYRFEAYRSGMAKAEIEPPEVKPALVGPTLSLTATVALGPLPDLVPWEEWRIGVSAVVEARDGSRSYWALAHPPGKPDFHHRDCFAAELAPAATL